MSQNRKPEEARNYHRSPATATEIARSIEDGVVSGRLAPGERLQPVRKLARELEVSPSTVAAALADLRRRGVVVSEPRRGSRISSRPALVTPRLGYAVPKGARDLATGNPDPDLLPDLEQFLPELRLPRRLYYGGEAALPELVARVQETLRADGIPDENVCVVSGALDGVELALSVHLSPGDGVAVEDPSYTGVIDLVRALGLRPVPVAIDDRGMLPEELAERLAGVEAVILTPRAQNPTGAALDAERASALAGVLEQRPGALVIEDDHLGDVAGTPSCTTVTGRARWAVVRSVAKSLGPDLRLALFAGDARTVTRVAGRQSVGAGWVSHVLQRLVLALLGSPEVGELQLHAERVYRRRRDTLVAHLAQLGTAATGRSGLNVWVPVTGETDVVHDLLRRGWAVTAGERYRLETPPAIRVTTATLDTQEAARFAADLAEVLNPVAPARHG